MVAFGDAHGRQRFRFHLLRHSRKERGIPSAWEWPIMATPARSSSSSRSSAGSPTSVSSRSGSSFRTLLIASQMQPIRFNLPLFDARGRQTPRSGQFYADRDPERASESFGECGKPCHIPLHRCLQIPRQFSWEPLNLPLDDSGRAVNRPTLIIPACHRGFRPDHQVFADLGFSDHGDLGNCAFDADLRRSPDWSLILDARK